MGITTAMYGLHMTQLRFPARAAILALVTLAAGCMTRQASKPTPVFYPPRPEQPRLQFLKSFATSTDVAPQSRFSAFIAGKIPPRHIVKPYGLTFRNGQLLVCDIGIGAIDVLDLRKPRMSEFRPSGPGGLRVPINIAHDTDGTRYITDSARSQVLIFDADGNFTGAIGSMPSYEPDEATSTNAPGARTRPKVELRPTDVLVTTNRLFVTDLQGHCVKAYDKSTRGLLFSIPRDVDGDAAKLFQPTNLAMDRQGRLYVSDTGGFRVQQYDADGVYLRAFGRHGDRPGEFALPKGIAVDREGRLYVVDAKMQVIQIFDADGKLLLYFGEPGASSTPLYLPAKVIIDYDHVDLFKSYAAPDFALEYLVIVSNQYGDRKVSVYGFGHPR